MIIVIAQNMIKNVESECHTLSGSQDVSGDYNDQSFMIELSSSLLIM